MEVTQYYVTTLTNAFSKIGPIIVIIIVGYFIFFKLPFLFFLRGMKKSKDAMQNSNHDKLNQDNLLHLSKSNERKEQTQKEKAKKETPKETKSSNDRFEEVLFEIRPGQAFSKTDLKKKYHELLRMNHPDKVASLSPEFKRLADKRTKEINDAYTKLLKRAV